MSFNAPTTKGFALPRVRWETEDQQFAAFSNLAPILSWERFSTTIFDITPGEHVGIFGSTGQGKTTLMNRVLPKLPFTAVFATKNNDNTMDFLIEDMGYMRMPKWRQISAKDAPRRVVWPPGGKIREIVPRQQEIFTDALDHIWAEGGRPKHKPVGWAVAIDEVWWFARVLHIDLPIKILLQQGRSNGNSAILATQRPAWVPTEMYSAPTHLFFFNEEDEGNLARISETSASNKHLIKAMVPNLPTHQVLYINTRTKAMARTSAPRFVDQGR